MLPCSISRTAPVETEKDFIVTIHIRSKVTAFSSKLYSLPMENLETSKFYNLLKIIIFYYFERNALWKNRFSFATKTLKSEK